MLVGRSTRRSLEVGARRAVVRVRDGRVDDRLRGPRARSRHRRRRTDGDRGRVVVDAVDANDDRSMCDVTGTAPRSANWMEALMLLSLHLPHLPYFQVPNVKDRFVCQCYNHSKSHASVFTTDRNSRFAIILQSV